MLLLEGMKAPLERALESIPRYPLQIIRKGFSKRIHALHGLHTFAGYTKGMLKENTNSFVLTGGTADARKPDKQQSLI